MSKIEDLGDCGSVMEFALSFSEKKPAKHLWTLVREDGEIFLRCYFCNQKIEDGELLFSECSRGIIFPR